MVRIAICDDQKELRVEVQQLLQEYMAEHQKSFELEMYETGKNLLMEEKPFDIILMDIELEYENGIDIIQNYPYKKISKVIFVTSHIEEMPKGYHVRAFRFLIKPVDKGVFYEALTEALKEIMEDGRLLVRDGEHEVMIRYSEICYIEAASRAVCVRTEDNTYIFGENIEKIRGLLTGPQFYQTHRSYIVNMDYIGEVHKTELVMRNGERVKISMLKTKEFKDKIYFTYIRRRTSGS